MKEIRMREMIFAGIITYNADIKILENNLTAISHQLNEMIIVDNGSKNIEKISEVASKFNSFIIKNENNEGIAKALNQAMQCGVDRGYSWMLSLDQDSICPDKYVIEISRYLSIEDNIGVVAPIIVDRTFGVIGHNPVNEYAKVNTCITSGSVVNVGVWESVGGYDESMFIDLVDFEYCYRVRKQGYSVIQIRDIKLEHKLGDCERHKLLFWNIRVNNHSASRKYFIARNNIYYPKKHHLHLHFIRGNLRNLQLIFIILLYENSKLSKIKSVSKGWYEGIQGVK